jgi:hypothetical protein
MLQPLSMEKPALGVKVIKEWTKSLPYSSIKLLAEVKN